MSIIRKSLLFVPIILLFACTQERTATPPADLSRDASTTAPGGAVSLAIMPREANRRTVLGISTSGFDPATARIEWYVNGAPCPSETPTQLSCAALPKGSKVHVQVTINGQPVQSNVVEIRNSPPVITDLRMVPHANPQGSRLAVEVDASDPDGDEISYRYAWTRNSAPAGSGPEVGANTRRGDTVSVEVTPYDGQDWGDPVKLNRDITNIPPAFVQNTNFVLNWNILIYQARANDPDGDAVVFSLEAPPAGMTINGQTGELRWTIPADFNGEQSATIVADDSHGGTARYTVTFGIKD